ncbi:N-acetylmuramoyl-L-alanine amidase family protein [Streptococcus pneumoniae]|uniref:N-acetylmuramoyl-L-alanine amidase family protein n=1 Tax=Streptococcus pneumoniae TaxID=1313 RepID=UPI0005DAD20B|nr:hypothetical protein [Streptococcus pneumoniae]MDV8215523.1 hypothetical protein [Streptococcus pneumoniae]MDV8564644.1 hypothetical protein [Streptococcus pneumoniae]CTN85475.1 hypothetical protein ERS044126_00431 [Streptococcus pneumoniae]CWE61510.1 choline-binding protein F [Streptococcus pneumoniae]SNH85012.1 choline-binding protein F [Streptococcus pneumoniae]
MKLLKKMMQVLLAVFFFGLLATNTVFANTTGGRFVDKDNRKYYVKDDHKAIYWHKIDGKTYYFGDIGEMVVGWQYLEIHGTGYRDNLFDNQPVNEIGLQEKWYYLDPSNGDMKIGWTKVNGKWYYLNSSGAMVTGSQTIDGKVYNFASSGEWI